MLAAGNRVIMKPSEYAPSSAELLHDMVPRRSTATASRSRVGGLHLSRAFARVRWDHLLYTGSPATGARSRKAAAEQLVPVTLELGGKCPAIIAEDSIDAESVKQILGTKALKNGQMCISVDYCLLPRERMDDFARLAAEYVKEAMPGYRESDSCTGIIRPATSIGSRGCSTAPGHVAVTCGRSRRQARSTRARASYRSRSCSTLRMTSR